MSIPVANGWHDADRGRRALPGSDRLPTLVKPGERGSALRTSRPTDQVANYSLHHEGRDIALLSVRHDHAALEALQLLGARLVSNRPRRGSVGPEVSLTVYALSRQLNLSTRRLQSFSSLPRPVSPDYLSKMRLPDRLMAAEHQMGERRLPFLVYLAKVLNADDGRLRPHHEWMQCESETMARLLVTPPVEWNG